MEYLRLIILAVTALLLSSCTGERCIEADDFGHAVFTVSSRYDKEAFDGQVGENQIAPWVDSTYQVNGRPLTIMIKGWDYGTDYNTSWELSAWCAWYGTKDNKHTLSKFCERLRDCTFVDGTMCTETADARIDNAPCLFRNGVGLYGLIAKRYSDPNESLESQRAPDGISFHLGEPTSGYKMYDVDKKGNTREVGGLVYKYTSEEEKSEYSNSRLYFKILDKFYDDNNGQYKVIVKSGINRTNPDPITYVTNLVKKFLFGVDGDYGLIRSIYLGIVNNPGYRSAVSAILSLYIMFTALSYLAGNVQLTHTELIVRVGKIAIVSALLSAEYSWTFFNDYLFVYFIGGVEQILGMIMEAGATGPGSPGILAMMIAPQTLSKLFSLLFVDWLGFIYIILFMAALYFVIMIFFQAAVIYLTALIAIGMIITMGPIFICFMLFGITRSLFENWLRQLTSYALQPVILFTGLIFISMILRQEIYGALGFRVCKKDFPKMGTDDRSSLFGDVTQETLGYSLGDSIFYWWFPKPMKGNQFSRELKDIPIPIDHFTTENRVVGEIKEDGFCEAYGCIGKRYVDLPFLDPVKDARRLSQFWNGKFVQLDGMLLIFAAIYLLNKFNGLAVSLAKFITDTSGNYTDINRVRDAIQAQTFDKSNAYLASMPGRARRGATNALDRRIGRKMLKASGEDLSGYSKAERDEKARKMGQAARQQGISKMKGYTPGGLIDRLRISRLKKEALTSGANMAVLKEVRKKTGLSQPDIDKNAKQAYRKKLADMLKKMNPAISQKDADKLAKQMSKRKPSAMKDELAKAKYGKKYDKLSKKEELEIKKLYNDPKLRKLARDAEKARKFQQAYVDAYAEMSNRGIGLVGKHSSAIRSLEEIKYGIDQRRARKRAEQRQTGEEIFSGIAGLKSGLYSSISGGKPDTISRTFAGGAYHDIDTGTARKQTYAEQLEDNRRAMKHEKLNRTIENLSSRYGENITSPEFLAGATRSGDEQLSMYRGLEREAVSNQVYQALASGEEPALMGSSYMKDYATDSEMERMIDRAYKVQEELIEDDPFINREFEYETNMNEAAERIKKEYDELVDHYGRDVEVQEIPALMQEYFNDLDIDQDEARSRITEVYQAMSDYQTSQEVLQQIDHRKVEIAQEVDKHVGDINSHRKNAGMEEYRPQHEDLGLRRVRKIEDHLRNRG